MKVERRNKVTRKLYRIRPTNSQKSFPVKIEKVQEEPDENEDGIIESISPDHELLVNEINSLTANIEKGNDKIVESGHITVENVGSYEEHESEPEQKPKIKGQGWGKYEKKYKIQWEMDPTLKEWITPDPQDPGRASCRYCCCLLRAHRTDLYKHSETRKHQRNATHSSSPSSADGEKKIVLSRSKSGPKFKTSLEKLPQDGSVIIVQGEQPLTSTADERDASSFFMDIRNDTHVETCIDAERDPDQEARELANRIGVVLIDDLEKILKSKGAFKLCRGTGDFSEHNIRRMAKIGVGFLSQKYLIESAIDSRSKAQSSKDRVLSKELSSTFRAIEEKLERTAAEMKSLKRSLNNSTDSFNLSSLDLRDLLGGTST